MILRLNGFLRTTDAQRISVFKLYALGGVNLFIATNVFTSNQRDFELVDLIMQGSAIQVGKRTKLSWCRSKSNNSKHFSTWNQSASPQVVARDAAFEQRYG